MINKYGKVIMVDYDYKGIRTAFLYLLGIFIIAQTLFNLSFLILIVNEVQH